MRSLNGAIALALGVSATTPALANNHVTGDMVEVAPPASVVQGAYESRTELRVFREASQLVLPNDVEVNISSPGTYNSTNVPASTTIPAGTKVNSYFVHFDIPTGTAAELEGSVTFTGKIVGIIIADSKLDNSDSLSQTATVYPTGTFGRRVIVGEGGDLLTLDANQKTMTVHLRVGAGALDQIRVLTIPTACVLDFQGVTPPVGTGPFYSCYELKYPTEAACEAALGTVVHIPSPPPDGQDAEVTSWEWYEEKTCDDLRKDGTIPPWVKLLATGVDLTATQNGSGVDLTLTTSAELDTAELTILRGVKLDNGGTAISSVCTHDSGGSPYTCTDNVVGDNYRVLETEYDGNLIVYDEVTVE